jgi:diadenosine tetraphosphate (Ap4A) HIT family hydrolase
MYDTHLLAGGDFIVIPAVGPLSLGHVMIVSRTHLPNLGAMSRESIAEYEKLVGAVCSRLGVPRHTVLEAEHGSHVDDAGGACISHVHVNVIPEMAQYAEMFTHVLPPLPVRHDLTDLLDKKAPYILLRNSESAKLHDATGVPSQLIRRRIFELLGRDDWDWGAYPAIGLIERTIELWNK